MQTKKQPSETEVNTSCLHHNISLKSTLIESNDMQMTTAISPINPSNNNGLVKIWYNQTLCPPQLIRYNFHPLTTRTNRDHGTRCLRWVENQTKPSDQMFVYLTQYPVLCIESLSANLMYGNWLINGSWPTTPNSNNRHLQFHSSIYQRRIKIASALSDDEYSCAAPMNSADGTMVVWLWHNKPVESPQEMLVYRCVGQIQGIAPFGWGEAGQLHRWTLTHRWRCQKSPKIELLVAAVERPLGRIWPNRARARWVGSRPRGLSGELQWNAAKYTPQIQSVPPPLTAA
jgi:hypothetical protein